MELLHKLFEINDIEYLTHLSKNKYVIDDENDEEDIIEIEGYRNKYIVKLNKINNRQFKLNNKRYYINKYIIQSKEDE